MPVYKSSDHPDYEKMGWTGYYLATSESEEYAHDHPETFQQNMIHQNFDISPLGINDTRYNYNHFGHAHAHTQVSASPKPNDRNPSLQPPLNYWNPIKHDPTVSTTPDLEKHKVPFVCHKQLEKEYVSSN
ncbi:hypothetical protein N7493_005140 [Penicillium malachiteum]|uniref:Uncharacterized protein n=1 Tax=Penicillium malachiteum TaxID=1324776 RepID=A0AAD6MW92_9EURO|nr:hypothetical protein N7493_005140 [Penicillium malachiteum]